jgi:hypothetical protein
VRSKDLLPVSDQGDAGAVLDFSRKREVQAALLFAYHSTTGVFSVQW